MRPLPVVLAAVTLAGCAGHRGTFLEHPTGGWNSETVATAQETWLYAQLSNNAYQPVPPPARDTRKQPPFVYVLPPDVREISRVSQDYYDLQYFLYQRDRPGLEPEMIMAFRGTQFTHWRDWWQGNLLGSQNLVAAGAFDVLRERYGGRPFSVTGHSLGGGIATYISVNRPGVRSYIFNSSPRFWRDTPGDPDETVEAELARRRSVVEFGEVLRIVRGPATEATQVYTSVGCTTGHDAIEQHSISRLATCLTFIAAYVDPLARKSICDNNLGDHWPVTWRRPPELDC